MKPVTGWMAMAIPLVLACWCVASYIGEYGAFTRVENVEYRLYESPDREGEERPMIDRQPAFLIEATGTPSTSYKGWNGLDHDAHVTASPYRSILTITDETVSWLEAVRVTIRSESGEKLFSEKIDGERFTLDFKGGDWAYHVAEGLTWDLGPPAPGFVMIHVEVWAVNKEEANVHYSMTERYHVNAIRHWSKRYARWLPSV